MNSRIFQLALAGALVIGSGTAAFAQAAGPECAGESPAQLGRAATHALNMLEAKGFSAYSHFNRVGCQFSAHVEKQGRMMRVLIRPGMDQIQPVGPVRSL